MSIDEVVGAWPDMTPGERLRACHVLLTQVGPEARQLGLRSPTDREALLACLLEGSDEALRSGDPLLEARLLDLADRLRPLDPDRSDRLAARWSAEGRTDFRAAVFYVHALGRGVAAGSAHASAMRDLILAAARARPERAGFLLAAMDAYGIGGTPGQSVRPSRP
ncbi:MAG TPA: hypothetical protein VGE01_02085 [Fimbriimonas sp.]